MIDLSLEIGPCDFNIISPRAIDSTESSDNQHVLKKHVQKLFLQ
jgi:hypothetical protein